VFLTSEILLDGGPIRFNVVVQRLLHHLGFDDVRNIDGAGDGGGDILAVRGRELFVLQCKWTSRQTVSRAGVDEVERAKAKYSADRAVLVTNAEPDAAAWARKRDLAAVGIRIDFWLGRLLEPMLAEAPDRFPSPFVLRPYQSSALESMKRDLVERRRALLVLATGLGKTVIAGEIIAAHLAAHPMEDILVVAHMKELVQQLEKALWRHLSKTVPTQVLTGDQRPRSLAGVTCATVESAYKAVSSGYRPSLVMIDETHHVSESGEFQSLLDALEPAYQFGVTATPWRGDEYDITRRFGPASFKMGIAEGMGQGYLAQAEYRLMVDDIDWDVVRNTSTNGYSIRELNERLFLPQRDEALADELLAAWSGVNQPRAIVFCRTIEHAEHLSEFLSRYSPSWRRAACLHSGRSRRDRDVLMSQFRLGRVPLVTVVDIFNEGVDIPDVNLICFARVTHSRRIFVQQLGRGLRLMEGKDRVVVLDFVTDIRRIAAALDIKRTLAGMRSSEVEHLELPRPSTIAFSNDAVGTLMEAWIRDAADLETAADDVKLQFPDLVAGL
jgi:superfamily II DNA or RNA helicase